MFAVAFGVYIWLRVVTNQEVGSESCAVQQDTFYLQQTYEQVVFYKKTAFLSLVGPSDSGKTYLIHEWLKTGTFQPHFDKIYFFYQHSQQLYDVMQKEIDNLEFVQGVHFEFINTLKNNGTK